MLSGIYIFPLACTSPENSDTGHWADGIQASLISSGVQTCEPTDSLRAGRLWPADGGELAQQTYLQEGNSTDPADSRSQDWGIAVADFDQDGHLDLYRSHLTAGNLYFGDGTGQFRLAIDGQIPISPENKRARGVGAIPADIDGDGDMDLTVSRSTRSELLLNDGSGMFTDATDRLPISEGSGIEFAVSWADYDLDGDLDLFLPRYPQSEPDLSGISPGIDSLLYENDGSNHFVDVSHLLPVDTNDGYPFVGGWHDLDEDGRPDLILANDHGHEVRSNRAWHNQPDGFVDVSKDWGLNIGIDAMGMAAGDVNRDGRPDFAWTGWPELEVLESDGMNWIRSGDARGLVPVHADQQVGWGLDWGDLNNDGWLDLMVAFSHWENFPEDNGAYSAPNPLHQPDALFIQQANGQFQEVAADWGLDSTGNSRSFVFADFNEDGWLDMVLSEVWGPMRLFLSECGCGNWVWVELAMDGGNSRAIGATISITTTDGTQTGWIRSGGTNIASGGPPKAHFGLGDATLIDELVVKWPDGECSTFRDIPANQNLKIVRDD